MSVMMSVQITPPTPFVYLLIISGVVAQDGWDVNYSPESVCAVKGSTVNMGCTYKYPPGYVISKTLWSTELITDTEPLDLSLDPEYRDRVQYLEDKQFICTLTLRDVTEKDQRKYYFRFITTTTTGKYQGKTGVQLKVTDLQVETPERVVEGDDVSLTCKTSCSLTDPTYIWSRDGVRLTSSTNHLRLHPVSREDAGRYSCTVQNHRSSDVTVDVMYPPKNVSVSISPSGEIVEGSSVTLTCSSDANPPGENVWFKGQKIGKGTTHTILNISSEDTGEYKCKSSNELGNKYSAVTLNVLYPPKNVSVSISPSGEILEGSSVTLTCSSDANPPGENVWFKGQKIVKGTTHTILNISSEDTGEYKCKSSNELGNKYSAVTLNVLYPPKNVSVKISPSGEIVEGSSVTLTCRSDANPPVQNYTWFKEGGTSPVATGQSYRVLQSGSYYCATQNEYGSQTAGSVSVTLKAKASIIFYIIVGIVLSVAVVLLSGVFWIRRKRRANLSEDPMLKQDNVYSNITTRGVTNDPAFNLDLASQDVQYASVAPQPTRPRKFEGPAMETPGSEPLEGVEHASVQRQHNKFIENDDIQYASVRFTHNGPGDRSAAPSFEDSSVIYSSMK